MLDEAGKDFLKWVEAKGHERKIGPIGKQPGKGQTWVPKYDTVGDILAEYGEPEPDPTAEIDREAIAQIVASIDAEHLPEF